MKYYLGDVAKIVGTTKEGIRYLEKKNLVQKPALNESGYREYDVLEVAPIRWMRLYHSYGFSVREIKELMEMEDFGSVSETLAKGVKRLDAKLDFLKKARDDLQKMCEDTGSMEEKKRIFVIGERPALYRVSLVYDQMGAYPKGFLDPWFENMPLVKSTQIHHMKDLKEGRDIHDLGLGIWEKDISGWFPGALAGVEYFPAEPCVRFWREGPPITLETLSPVLSFMEKHNMELAGDILSRAVATVQRAGEQRYVHEFFAPYRERN